MINSALVLENMGYSWGEIHNFHSYFLLSKVIIKDPTDSIFNRLELEEKRKGQEKVNRLLLEPDKKTIEEFIVLGSMGLDYTLKIK